MKRRTVLILSALLLHSSWGPEFKWLCNPVLSCHSCVLAWFACPIGVLVHYSGYRLFPFAAFGTILLVGSMVGRLLCGWVCPFGLVQDWLHRIPSKKFDMPEWTANIKFVLLFLTVFLFPFLLGESTWLSFCRICPAAALQVSVPGVIGAGLSSISWAMILRFSVLGAVAWLAIRSNRSFCKAFCPIGAIMAPFNLISFWKVKAPRSVCLSCAKCDKACGINVKPSKRLPLQIPANRTLDCIVCHECQTACESTIKPQNPGAAMQEAANATK